LPETTQEHQRLTILAVYSWREFWSMGEGGGAPSFFLSITSFPKRGHEMHVLMPGRPGDAPLEDYHGVTLHRVTSAVDFMHELSGSKLLQHIRRLLSYVYWFVRVLPAGVALARRVRPDVIFGMGELGAPAAFIVSRLRGVPCVTRGDELAAMLGVDGDRFLFFLDGVYKDRFMTAERDRSAVASLGVPDGNRVVLSVARLVEEKHVDRLLRAAPGVLSERTDVTFLIVGAGEERDRLEALATELGISDNVVFAGSVSHDDLPGVYASSDVFATLADRTNEFNTLYESMLSALPVVALNTGRTADFVDTGRTGVLLSLEELPDLPRVILELLQDDARARSLGDAARAWVDETFPTIEERQTMEAEVLERAVSERSA
jgi:glycosyltransferase involved in cell wall biosynthesis